MGTQKETKKKTEKKKFSKMGCFTKCMTIILLALQFVAVACILGVSAYLQAQVRDNENILSMVPLCFTCFAIQATIIGFISIGKQSKCGFTLYAVMSSICIIGFFAAMVMTAMWLTGKDVLPDSLVEWIEEHGDTKVNTGQLSDLCNDFEDSDVEFSNIDLNDVDDQDGLKNKIEAAMAEFKVTKDQLKELLGYCRAEKLLFELLAGKSEDTSEQTIAIMLGICCGCGGLVLDYLLTLIFGCAHVRREGQDYA